MGAISRSKVKIWIVPAGTAPSTLLTTTTFNGSNLGYVAGQIENYNQSGGESDVESVPVFGGFVDKEKPISQVELSFDVIPDVSVLPDIWESFIYGTNVSATYVMSSSAAERAVFIQAEEGSAFKSVAYNNAKATGMEMDHAADDNRTVSMTFKFSPTNESGISNYMSRAVTVTALPAWTTLTA